MFDRRALLLILASACSAPTRTAPQTASDARPQVVEPAPSPAPSPALSPAVAAVTCGAPAGPGMTPDKVVGMLQGDDDYPVAEFRALGAGVIPALAEVARASSDAYARQRAISMLGDVGCRDVAPVLVAVLQDPDPLVRLPATVSLGKVLGADATPTLVGMLGDADTGVVKFSIKTLADHGDRRAVDPLQQFRRATSHAWLGALAKDAVKRIEARAGTK